MYRLDGEAKRQQTADSRRDCCCGNLERLGRRPIEPAVQHGIVFGPGAVRGVGKGAGGIEHRRGLSL